MSRRRAVLQRFESRPFHKSVGRSTHDPSLAETGREPAGDGTLSHSEIGRSVAGFAVAALPHSSQE
jgi:hypothetical protein